MRQISLVLGMFALGAIAVIPACSDTPVQNSDTSPAPPPDTTEGKFSALIDGIAWKATTGKAIGTASPSGMFTITAFDSTRAVPVGIKLSLYNIAGPGQYALGVLPTVVGGAVDLLDGTTVLRTASSGTAGTVVLTKASPTRVTGTFFTGFSFPVSGGVAGSRRTITEASFDVPITAAGPIDVPANRGSQMFGTIGGEAWRAGDVQLYVSPDGGLLRIIAENTLYRVTHQFENFTGVGIYPLAPTASGGLRIHTFRDDWAVNSGTVIVSAFNDSRVSGTIDAFVVPQPGSEPAGPLKVVFTFDVGRATP